MLGLAAAPEIVTAVPSRTLPAYPSEVSGAPTAVTR